MKPSIIVFPGSNCDRDIFSSLQNIYGKDPNLVWYEDDFPKKTDLIIIPGGFSFGDYLRCGAIASKSKALNKINIFIKKGTPIIGICNGFQILTEAGFLPGTLLMNKNLKFICKCVDLLLTNKNCKFTNSFNTSRIILPIAHKVGNYYINQHGLNSLIENDQIIFRYSSSKGQCNDANNPNGSIYNIAGIINKRGNVLGMMPHPERFYNNIDKDLIMKRIIESISNAR
tara:strand:+ start:90 stop:773 length:684 start_codon:yes stop_codon:yes gene_type:complete